MLGYLFHRNDWTTGEEIANHLTVSDRTVRNYVTTLNTHLKHIRCSILSKRGEGYKLVYDDKDEVYRLLSDNNIMDSAESRLRRVAVKVILSDESTDIADLEDEFYLSRTRIDLIMKEIQMIAERFGLNHAFVRANNAVECNLDESNKRRLAAEFINSSAHEINEIVDNSYDYFSRESFIKLQEIVQEFMDDYSIITTDKDMMHIVIITYVQLIRIQELYSVTCDKTECDSPILPYVHEVTSEILEAISSEFDVSYNCEETLFFSEQFSNLRVLSSQTFTKSELVETLENKYTIVVQQLLDDIRDEFQIDLTGDDKLFVDLALHIRFSSGMMTNQSTTKNPMLDEIKNKFPFVFELSTYICKRYEDFFDSEINENQLSYIAAHLGSALERRSRTIMSQKPKIALCSSLNVSILWLLVSRLNSLFGDDYEVIGPYPIYQFENVKQENPVLILSTSWVPDTVLDNISVLTISPHFEEKDNIAVDKILQKIRNRESQMQLPEKLASYFKADLFYNDCTLETQNEVLEFITYQIEAKGYTADNLLKSTLERESMSSTAFQNGVAIPHPVTNNALQTVIAVIKLRKPISWGGTMCNMIFYVVTNAAEKRYLKVFFSVFSDIVTNREKVSMLYKERIFDKFVEEFLM